MIPVENVIPLLERLIQERDLEAQQEFFKRWMPKGCKERFDLFIEDVKASVREEIRRQT